ncbi:MAG: M20/M25/M40 family metallo-hydrolase, partial [Chloroflexi bacterium]|nr:M20/M25/M40 family metallo-hydrolase [Chloroflexota bacterium]
MIDFVKVTKDIISINTTAPPGLNYKEAIDYLEPLFKQLGCDTQKISIPPQYADGKNDRWSLLAHNRHPGKPRLILYGHIDVVPAEGWDAFVPREESGKIFGRGAADMKGAITAILLGIQEVKEKSLKYDLSIMITTDEEIGQAGQIRYLARYLEPL